MLPRWPTTMFGYWDEVRMGCLRAQMTLCISPKYLEVL